MDRQIIHKTVEYIKLQPEFPFDVIDVEESVNDVLAFFGLHPELSAEERTEVRRELVKKARSAELAEVSRLVELGAECPLSRVMARLRPYRRTPYSEPSVSAGGFVQKMRL